ncbi:MAG: P1 family peptidase [Acidobacteriota bacterium]
MRVAVRACGMGLVALLSASLCLAEAPPRARDLGIPFDGTPGRFNAVTDVPGVEVGYKTLISGQGVLQVGKGPVRTGVTVILPKGRSIAGYPAAWFSLNGDGELTGMAYVKDYGMGFGPIGITNTNSVGVVRDAISQWDFRNFGRVPAYDVSSDLPIVGETWDGLLNDIDGFHVTKEDVWEALKEAHGGAVAEGDVGGGTGMALYEFKGGSGTASRVFKIGTTQYTLGVFVQANFGRRDELTVAGVPVGKEIRDDMPVLAPGERKDGSCIAVVITDAPLLPSQLKLVAKRVTHGIARTGTISHDGSGEIFLAISTAAPALDAKSGLETWQALPKWDLDPVFRATVQATEEAILNALVAAKTMDGINGNTLFGVPQGELRSILEKYHRLAR